MTLIECEKIVYDIWHKMGSPSEITEKSNICSFLENIVKEAGEHLLFDHFSGANFDHITRIECDNDIVKIYWKDFDIYRQQLNNKTLSDDDDLTWACFGYATFIFFAIKIEKIKIISKDSHLYILLKATYCIPKNMRKDILGNNKVLETNSHKSSLIERLVFYCGPKEENRIVSCSYSSLPYYSAIIQPRHKNTTVVYSKILAFSATMSDLEQRLKRVEKSIHTFSDSTDSDELEEKGNTIRRIMENLLKYCCVIYDTKLEIKDKYGHIELGKLRKDAQQYGIDINQGFINIANELSHDSGKHITLSELKCFYDSAIIIFRDVVKASENEMLFHDFNRKNDNDSNQAEE